MNSGRTFQLRIDKTHFLVFREGKKERSKPESGEVSLQIADGSGPGDELGCISLLLLSLNNRNPRGLVTVRRDEEKAREEEEGEKED